MQVGSQLALLTQLWSQPVIGVVVLVYYWIWEFE